MEAKRTKVEIKYSRTIQLRQYEPLTVGMTTTLENIDGVSEKDFHRADGAFSRFPPYSSRRG